MKSTLIIWPLLAQLAIPFWVLTLNALRKNRDRQAGNVNPDSVINNKAWSLPVVLTSNALDNQFQFPIVFYVLCLILAHFNAVSAAALVIAWVFVVCRWLHAIVHVTSNTVKFRFAFFAISMLSLLSLFGVTLGVLLRLS